MAQHLIINADDFGSTEGINRGIADCHRTGVVTSTSLRPPDHLDSHHHLHLDELLLPIFIDAGESLGIPLRGDGAVQYVGGFDELGIALESYARYLQCAQR